MNHNVELRGYRVLWPLPLVLLTTASAFWFMFGTEAPGSLLALRVTSVIAAVLGVAVFALFAFRLVIEFDPATGGVRITRKHYIGITQVWVLPVGELERWYYAHSIQTLVVRRRSDGPLRFVLNTANREPAHVLQAVAGVLGDGLADLEYGKALSRRVIRTLVGVSLTVVALGAIGLTVFIMTL